MFKLLTTLASLAVLLVVAASTATGQPSATSFTYQGSIEEDGVGIDASRARIAFRLWDAETGGTQVGTTSVAYPVVVVEGIFTATVDFSEGAFGDTPRWLEIGVDPDGGFSYTWFTPRQPVTAAPVALYALHCGDSTWELTSGGIYYAAGNVGIGTSEPEYALDVRTSGTARTISGVSSDASGARSGVYGQSSSEAGCGVRGAAVSLTGETAGVRGECSSPDGHGVHGSNSAANGAAVGVYGTSRASNGSGIYGRNTSDTGDAYGVYGVSDSPTGFGGYFLGRGYFSGRVGIGVANPSEWLDVCGKVKMSGFQLTPLPTPGYVLTCDANGNGSWEAPTGGGLQGSGMEHRLARFATPTMLESSGIYETDTGRVGIGTTTPMELLHVNGTAAMAAFKLYTNPTAGYVLTSDGAGNGTWQEPTGGGSGFTLPYEGSVASESAAFQVTNSGTAMGSHAIRGCIDNPSSSGDAAAGCFSASGSNGTGIAAFSDHGNSIYAHYAGTVGHAVYAFSSGAGGGRFSCTKTGGVGVHGLASGAQGLGVVAEAAGADGIGLRATGQGAAAEFYGNLAIYEYGTTNKVIELGKGLDYAEGFDVADATTEITPGTVLVIDPTHPGQLACSRTAYDPRVAGIVAGANGLGSGVRLGAGEFDHDVALAGRVYCNVVALGEDIQPGDMLTTSDIAGYAMKAADRGRAPGAVLGKAMEPMAKGERGRILVLVTLQ